MIADSSQQHLLKKNHSQSKRDPSWLILVTSSCSVQACLYHTTGSQWTVPFSLNNRHGSIEFRVCHNEFQTLFYFFLVFFSIFEMKLVLYIIIVIKNEILKLIFTVAYKEKFTQLS